MKRPSPFMLVLPWLCLLTAAAADRPHFESKLRDGAMTIDGRYDDWYGSLQPFGSDPVSVQFLNDGEFLYMRLTASDASTRMQIARRGFTVWFDPAGGTKRHLGIRFPVVEGGADDGDRRGRGGLGGGRGRPRGGEGPDEGRAEESSPSDRVDILGPGKDDARSLTRDHLPGIDVAMRIERGTLQYELRVPLARTADHPYTIEAVAGKAIGVGLETGRSQQRSFDSGGRGFGGMGGGGIGGRGMGGRGGGMRGGGMRGGDQPPKPLKGWATVTMAPAPAR